MFMHVYFINSFNYYDTKELYYQGFKCTAFLNILRLNCISEKQKENLLKMVLNPKFDFGQ